jgi:O-antigen/teichoic acid export membrane protein
MSKVLETPSLAPRSLSSRFRLNVLSYGYTQLVTLAAQLVLVPFFLHAWGTGRYADWLVLTGIPSMLSLLDLGVAQASATRATVRASQGDVPGARRSVQTALAFTLAVVALVLLFALTLGQWIDWVALLKLKSLDPGQASLVVVFMSGYLCTRLLGGPIDAWFRVIDKTVGGVFIMANRRTLDILLSIVILLLGGSELQLAQGMFFSQMLFLVLVTLFVRRISPWPLLGLASASWAEFRGIWKPAVGSAAIPLAQVITLQGGLQLLNQIAGPAVVVGYTMARTLMRLIIQLGITCSNALTPEISRLAGRGEFEQARRFTQRASSLVLGVCVLVYGAGIWAGPQIIALWSHGLVQVDRLSLALIGSHTILNVAWFILAAMLISTNRHTRTSVIYALSSLAALLLWMLCKDRIDPLLGASLLLSLPELVVLVYLRLISKVQFAGEVQA